MTSQRPCWQVTFLSGGFAMTPFPSKKLKKFNSRVFAFSFRAVQFFSQLSPYYTICMLR